MKFRSLILFWILPLVSYSQVELTGTVKDNSNEVIAFANVIVYDTSDQVVSGSTTNEEGGFVVSLTPATYKVVISYIGYKVWTQQLDLAENKDLGDVALELAEYNLAEVTVVGRKKLFTRKADRLVFNIEDNIATTGGDAMNALQMSPGVVVGQGGISMIGKSSMRVLIDDKLLQLSGEELTAFLSSIPADDIKEIEIISNPPSKYEAAGNSGLINIVFKKGRANSWNNSTSYSYTQSDFAYHRLGNNFKYQKNKVDLLFSVSGTLGDALNKQALEIQYPTGPSINTFEQKGQRDNVSARLLFDYKLSEKDVIGIQYLGALTDPSARFVSTATLFDGGTVVNRNRGVGISDNSNASHSINVHYNRKLDTLGRKLSLDLDYFDYDVETSYDFTSRVLLTNANDTINFANLINSNQKIKNYSAKVDVQHPFQFANIEYGAKLSFTRTDNLTNNFNTITGNPVFNPMLSNDFEFEENNQAIYVSASRSFGKRVNAKLGLRAENTQTVGFSVSLDQRNVNDYFRLFPTAYLSFMASENNTVAASYGRRISRPSFSNLDPARIFVTDVNFTEGNPFLNPSFIDNYELSYDHKGAIGGSLFYTVENDGFGQVPIVSEDNNDQQFTYQNFFRQRNYGVSIYGYYSKVKWWSSQNALYITQSDTDFFAEGVDLTAQNGVRVYFGTYNTMTLNTTRNLKAQVNFWINSPFKRNLYDYSSNYNLELALRYSLMKNKLQVSAGVYDVLNSRKLTSTWVTNGITNINSRNTNNRYFRLSLIYSTGNKKIKVDERNVGNQDEKQRAGN
ncbi:MAG: TonB-dependent receptor [Bacteroidota bacterium]